MRLRKSSWRGITRYQSADPVIIDFDALGPGLIALVGKNGEGKTTAAEIPMAAIDKQFPTRPGSLYDRCHGRDAFMEATFDDQGHDLTVRLAIDAVGRKTESYILRDGLPLTDGKAAGYDALVQEHLGSRALRLASVFAAQDKRGNFLGLPKTERKGLFLELLNLGALEQLATQARDRASAARAGLDRAREKAADLERQAADLADAPAALASAQIAVDQAAHRLETARVEETAATSALERARAESARVSELVAAELTARQAATIAASRLDEIQDRGPKAERRRDERVRFLDARKVTELEPAARRKHSDALARIAIERGSLTAKIEMLPDATAAQKRKDNATEKRVQAEALVAQTRLADEAVRGADYALGEAERDYERDCERVATETARLTKQAERMHGVPCTNSAPQGWLRPSDANAFAIERDKGLLVDLGDACPLLADARSATEQLARLIPADPALIVPFQSAHAAAVAARLLIPETPPDLRSFDPEIHAAVEQIAQANTGANLTERLAQLNDSEAVINVTLISDLEYAAEALRQDNAERLTIRDEYEAEILDLESAVTTARGSLTEARAAHAAAKQAAQSASSVDLPSAERSLSTARKDRESAEFQMREADQSHAKAQARADRLAQLAPLITAATAGVAHAEVDLGDWSLLERSLGRDGVQALEVDAAGPEVARITNELLTACYGPRFSLTFETLAEKRDGGMKEVFDVQVFDGASSRVVEDLSGGEQAIVGECLRNAISVYLARKSPIKYETLWRDETSGPLDPENARAYPKMLRRLLQLSGAHQVIYIAHDPLIWEAADAILYFADGKVTTQSQEVTA